MSKRRHLGPKLIGALFALLGVWLLAAYLLIPAFWHVHFSRRPAVTNGPRTTRTGSDIPSDPANLSFVGSQRSCRGDLVTEPEEVDEGRWLARLMCKD